MRYDSYRGYVDFDNGKIEHIIWYETLPNNGIAVRTIGGLYSYTEHYEDMPIKNALVGIYTYFKHKKHAFAKYDFEKQKYIRVNNIIKIVVNEEVYHDRR